MNHYSWVPDTTGVEHLVTDVEQVRASVCGYVRTACEQVVATGSLLVESARGCAGCLAATAPGAGAATNGTLVG
ncbi:MAG TPA: hypothetical protein VD813_13345 [Pseudonocardia sp.]|nr:hypothetical protein [Pseudonocardia sp.]